MKDLFFISAQPDDDAYSWQLEIFLENFLRLGFTHPVHVLLFTPFDRVAWGLNPRFKMLQERYENEQIKFFWYPDIDNLLFSGILESLYIPLLRPHILRKHFENFPWLEQKAIFYHDSDIVFNRWIDFSPFLEDDICYLSATGPYMDSGYFFRKRRNVLPHLLDNYDRIDVLALACHQVGISKEQCVSGDKVCGGAQYILKNITSAFWKKVERDCIGLRKLLAFDLGGINRYFFQSEKAGIQSWCADMWSLLWNLWKRGDQTATPAALNFCWATDDITCAAKSHIYHDAGVSEATSSYLFNKRDPNYNCQGCTPFTHDLRHVSRDFMSWRYCQEIELIKNKYYA